jgi:protein-disulfide isomerase
MRFESNEPFGWRPFPSGEGSGSLGGPPLAEPVDETDHVRGAPSALVTLVEYADFECLNCARAFPLLVRYLEELRGTLRLVFRHFPLGWEHPGSTLAARASEAAARRGKFWEMHDELFRNPGLLHREALHAHAASAGLDIVQFAADLDDASLVARIERDIASGRASSVHATPTFFVDGARYTNSRNVEGLRDVILEAALRQSERLLRGGDGSAR